MPGPVRVQLRIAASEQPDKTWIAEVEGAADRSWMRGNTRAEAICDLRRAMLLGFRDGLTALEAALGAGDLSPEQRIAIDAFLPCAPIE